ncbi:MAG: thiamine pyrophosphokinase [Chloroflexi bacterium OLB14]|nr:MAG: thiamine pyrophosphokinase [Chloroflexi bacterium OLB14]
MSRIIIFANGELPNLQKASALIKQDDFIICADGGTRHALAMGLTPHVIIGDMDSLPKNFSPFDNAQGKLSTFDGEVILYPKDKNETDLELAINHAITLQPDEIIILGALGGRIDHTLANISLLSTFQPFNLKLSDGIEEISLCKHQLQVKGRSGDVISLIPYQGNVEGVTTQNLKWKLNNETLFFNKTRGISNEMTANVATISITSGLLLIVHQISVVE